MSARVQGDLVKVAAPSARLLEKNLASGDYRYDECGDLEKRCSRCNDHWPADSEFFFSNGTAGDGLSKWCKACYVEWRYPNGRGSVDHQFHARAV